MLTTFISHIIVMRINISSVIIINLLVVADFHAIGLFTNELYLSIALTEKKMLDWKRCDIF